MLENIITMYITLLSPIVAGIFNMLFCKLPILKSLQKPIDHGLTLKDGKRLFGDSKTWKGLIGYVLLNIIFSLLFGFISLNNNYLLTHNYFYINHSNTLLFNLLIGVLLGLGYSLLELPNSFLKRRLEISQSKALTTSKKYFFIFLDQADSVIGCVLVVWLLYPIGWFNFIIYILIGSLTHLILNMLLYFMHLRKNMF